MKKIFTILILVVLSMIIVKTLTKPRPLDEYPQLSLAQEDLDSLFQIYQSTSGDKCNYTFKALVTNEIEDGSFSYKVSAGNQIVFLGSDQMAVSHAVYTFLGELGFNFDINGVSSPVEFTTISQITHDTLVRPTVRWRGIRQHVNFPMDISSYTIADAKKYLEDLVRLRFNKLTVHSYPGQWYESQVADTTMYAGHFFYGNTHYQHDNPFLVEKVPENDTLFCIPEAEALRHDAPKLSRFAMDWMQQLIGYAKELGFYVQFSFETRTDSPAVALAVAQSIYDTYPMVDALEMITEETGGWGKACTREEVSTTLERYFTPEIASNEQVLKPVKDKQSDLNYLYSQIGVHAQTIKDIHSQGLFPEVEMKLGIYCSITDYTVGAYRLARLALPDNMICILPSHGSNGVAKALPSVIENAQDLAQTEIYSWIEFDGLMYLLQNSINGNEWLFNNLSQIEQGVATSVLYNHWRTAENRTASAYVAQSTIEQKSPEAFYHDYAMRLGIADIESYTQAMELINKVDSYATSALGNIGFCWMGAWRSGGSYTVMNIENIDKARAMYLEAGELFSALLKQSEAGSEAYSYLSLLGNRTLCSIIYLDAFRVATELRTIKKSADGVVSPSEQQRALEICNRALLIFDNYMETHALMMPDRGCKGTLVSVWNAPIRGLKILREQLGGAPMDELPVSKDAVDAPPLPIFYEAESTK